MAPGSDQKVLPDAGLLTPMPATAERTRRPGVLVVDDEPCLREVVGAWLLCQGFAVWRAGSGREALEVCPPGCCELDF